MYHRWKSYVPVGVRRANARLELEKLRKKGLDVQPIEIAGRTIARSFWGKGWCRHVDRFSDYANRLPRGRTYVRNGSVCHLTITAGRIEAIVSGSSLYRLSVAVTPLARSRWEEIKNQCRGRIGSMLELLEGRLSDHVMAVVSDRQAGLFPELGEIQFKCDCPDWAIMCKHVAAVLYGVGNRLDHCPELLFTLRGVDAAELIDAELALPAQTVAGDGDLGEEGLAELFGIDLENTPAARATKRVGKAGVPAPARNQSSSSKRAGAKTRKVKKRRSSPPRQPIISRADSGAEQKQAERRQGASRSAPTRVKAPKRTERPAARRILNPDAPTGRAIARLRRRAGLSPWEFAEALGVTLASVQRWEADPGPLRIYARPLAALTRLQKQLIGR